MSDFYSTQATTPTPDSLAIRRKIAQQLIMQGADTSPVRAWTQGLSRALSGIAGEYDLYRTDKEQQAAREAAISDFSKAFGGAQPAPGAPLNIAPSVAQTPPPEPAVPGSPNARIADAFSALGGSQASLPPAYAAATSKLESGGDYSAVGPDNGKGRGPALGKYQVLASNVGPWSQEVLGKPLTPEQFLANPKAQDAIYNAKMGQYAQKYGPEGAARAWFAGEGGMNNPNARDTLGTTVQGYGNNFMAALNPTANVPPVNPQQPQAAPQGAPQVGGVNPALIRALSNPFIPPAFGQIAAGQINQQLAAPEFKQIGQSVLGQPQYGWVNPHRQTVTPIGGNAAEGASPATDVSFQKIAQAQAQGAPMDQLYQRVPQELREAVKSVIDGRGVPQSIGNRGAARTAVMLYAHAIDPTFDEALMPQRMTFARSMGSNSPTSIGGQKLLLGTSLGHLAELSDAALGMGNSSGPLPEGIPGSSYFAHGTNRVFNSSTTQAAKANALNDAVQKFSGEVGKLYSGSAGGGVGEREATRERFNANLSPPELAASLEMSKALIESKLRALENERDQVYGAQGRTRVEFLDKTAKANIAKIDATIAKLRGQQSAEGGQPQSGVQNVDPAALLEARRRGLIK